MCITPCLVRTVNNTCFAEQEESKPKQQGVTKEGCRKLRWHIYNANIPGFKAKKHNVKRDLWIQRRGGIKLKYQTECDN